MHWRKLNSVWSIFFLSAAIFGGCNTSDTMLNNAGVTEAQARSIATKGAMAKGWSGKLKTEVTQPVVPLNGELWIVIVTDIERMGDKAVVSINAAGEIVKFQRLVGRAGNWFR